MFAFFQTCTARAAIFALLAAQGFCATPPAAASPARAKNIVFLGDSLTAGFGLDTSQAYPGLVADKIAAAGLGARWNVVNAGVSGDTSAGGLHRLNWQLRQPVDVLVLALGANDGLRGQDPAAIEAALQTIVERARAKNPGLRVLVAGMMMPANLGADYREKFAEIFPRLARRNQAVLIPFLLEGVALDAKFNQPDGIHPNAAGQKIIAETVWKYLAPVLKADGKDTATAVHRVDDAKQSTPPAS